MAGNTSNRESRSKSRLFKLLLRLTAWLAAAVFVVVFLGALFVLNFNQLSPMIVDWVEDRYDGRLTVEEISLGWTNLNPRIHIRKLSTVRESTDVNLLLTIEQLEVTPALRSVFDRKLKVKDLTIAGSNLSGWVNVEAGRQRPGETGPREWQRNFFGFLESVQQLERVSVHDGSINIEWRTGDSEFVAAADYEFGSKPTDEGYSIVGNLKLELHHESEIRFVYDVKQGDRDAPQQISSVFNMTASQLDLAWLAPLEIPRLSLTDSKAVMDVEITAELEQNVVETVMWGVVATDPDLSFDNASTNEQTVLTMSGVWRPDHSGDSNGTVSVRAVVDSLDVTALLRQYPESFPPKFYNHMSERLHSLRVPSVVASLEGDPMKILQSDSLALDGRFADLAFTYGRKMPPLEHGSGRFQVRGVRFEATFDKASVHGSEVQDLSSVVPDIAQTEPEMVVRGSMTVPLAQVIELFGPEGSMQPGKSKIVHGGDGEGLLSITTRVPLRRGREFELEATANSENVTLQLRDGTTVTQVSGLVNFTRHGITDGILEGIAYGGQIAAEFKKKDDPDSKVVAGTAAGTVQVESLGNWLGEFGAANARGTATWEANYEFGNNVSAIHWRSDLKGVEVKLPAPLDKAEDEAWNLILDIDFANDSQRTLKVAVDSFLAAEFHTVRKDDAWQTTNGAVGIGAAMPKLEDSGLVVAINAPEIDYDSWSRLSDDMDDEDDANFLTDFRYADVRAAQVRLARDRNIHNVALNFDKTDAGWQVHINSDQIEGTMNYSRASEDPERGGPKVDINLSKCHIPKAESEPTPSNAEPGSMPTVNFVCDDAAYGELYLGRGKFFGVPTANGWAMQNIEFISPELRVRASGNWMKNAEQQSTEIEYQLIASNFGRAVENLGFGKKFIDGVGKLRGVLHWPDSAVNWAPATTSGDYEFNAIDGFIVDLDSTVSKLLVIFAYEKLLDRLTLNFSDIEIGGFEFDEISGRGKIKAGQFELNGFNIDGPAAQFTLQGTTDWAKREHRIDVLVDTKLTSALPTIVTAAVAPFAGFITYLAKDEIHERFKTFTGSHYTITGPWSEPKVTKVEAAQ